MDVDGRQGAITVVLGTQRPTATLLFEPHDGGTENTAFAQVIANPRLHDTKILTDDDGTRTLGFQQDDAHHGLVVVVHVGTLGRCATFWDPPQAEHAQDVVDANGAGVGQGGAHHVTQRQVARFREAAGRPRRLRPVLSLLRVDVRRGTDAHTRGEELGTAPLFGTVAVYADGQVSHDADLHADLTRHMLGVLELFGGDPLAPLVEVNTLGQLEALKLDARRRRTSKVLGQFDRTLALDESAPQRIVRQLRTATLDEAIQLALAMVGTRSSEDNLEGLALGLPRAITVDQVLADGELASLVAQLLDGRARSLGQGGVLLNALGTNVDRVEPTARHRQVGRVLQRRHRLRCVDRVDEQEIGTLVRTHSSQVSQIGGVTNAPRGGRARRVQLSVHTPDATRGLQERQGQRVRHDDEGRGLHVSTLDSRHEAVPAERQPVRHVKGRTADELTIDHARSDVAIHLITRALTAVLQHPLNVHPRAIRHVHWEHVAATLAGDDRRRQGTAPFALFGQAQSLVYISHRGRFIEGKSESAKDLQESRCAHAHPIPVPIPESGGYAISIGDTAQLIDVVRCGCVNIHEKAFYVAG